MTYDTNRFPTVIVDVTSKGWRGLYSCRDRVGSYLCKFEGVSKNNLGGIECHTGVRSIEPTLITDMITSYIMNVDGAPELWEYLSSLEGPFRKLFEEVPNGWEMIADEKEIFAIKFPDKVFEFKPYPLVYSLLICSRIPSEYPTFAKTYKFLVNNGVEKYLAFLMSPYIFYDDITGTLKKSRRSWDGSHQCLKEYESVYYKPGIMLIDVNKWKNGEFFTKDIKDNSESSKLWMMPFEKPLLLSRFAWEVYGSTTKSRFGGSVSSIKDEGLKKMVEDLKKYIEMRYKQ